MQEVANDVAGICHVICVKLEHVLFLLRGVFWTSRCLRKTLRFCVKLETAL